jgi:hypothetical protein
MMTMTDNKAATIGIRVMKTLITRRIWYENKGYDECNVMMTIVMG